MNESSVSTAKVFHCSSCLSLAIMITDTVDICNKCGCTEVIESEFKDWDIKYFDKYKRKFLE